MIWSRPGWRGRLGLPPLEPCPKVDDLPPATLTGGARYLGTHTPDGVVVRDHGLGGAGSARLQLSTHALDVVRLAGPFRIPVDALRGARIDEDGAALTVRWVHGGQDLETAFRLNPVRPLREQRGRGQPAPDPADVHRQWARRISRMVRGQG